MIGLLRGMVVVEKRVVLAQLKLPSSVQNPGIMLVPPKNVCDLGQKAFCPKSAALSSQAASVALCIPAAVSM